jgi:hypothetical protein
VLDGVFAAHPSVRTAIDFSAFVDASEHMQRGRFAAHYRWKGLDVAAMDELWRARMADEWTAVDSQRHQCDVVIAPGDI